MWYWHGMGFGGWLMMAAFWTLVVILIVWAVRSTTNPRPADHEGARGILDARLARGEIDPDEYQERRTILESRR